MARSHEHVLDDMREAIDGILGAVKGKTLRDYEREWLLRSAVQRGVEVISEASRRLPDDACARRPEIPWRQVRAVGNVLRHEYHAIPGLLIWRIAVDELPKLRVAVLALREELKP